MAQLVVVLRLVATGFVQMSSQSMLQRGNSFRACWIIGTCDCDRGGAIKSAAYQEILMFEATNAPRKRVHLSAYIPLTADATVVELAKHRLLAVTPLASTAAPAYTVTARVLHWVTALVIMLMIPLGVILSNDLGGSLQNSLYGLHESLGVLLIPIVLVRLAHRLTNPPLPLPQDIPALQRFAAHLTHLGLYTLLVTQPLVGWIAMSASGAPITVLGLLSLPSIVPENRVLSEQVFVLHGLIGFLIAGLVAAHIGAALYHHVVRKDRVLMRMITG
jgi:cytochrome b561